MGTSPQKHIVVIAGEASGDMRAAELISALKGLHPSIRFSGVGGQAMKAQGVELFEDITSLAVIGFVEVIKHFKRIKQVFNHVVAEIEERKPDAVILVDYPGFNLRLAKILKSKGIKVIFYISPQVWAWREKRVLKIKSCVDRMIVLFPFEEAVYRKYNMNVDYVGHPLVEEVTPRLSQKHVLQSLGLNPQKKTIGLLPGSRAKEVDRHLPHMLKAARILWKQNPDYQFLLLRASTIPLESLVPSIKAHHELPLKIYDGSPYDGINAVDGAMVASGTATLETALLGKPMVVIYKTSWVTYAIAKAVIKIPYISLVNIVAGKKIVEEYIQNNASAEKIAVGMQWAMNDPQLKEELKKVKEALGAPGASKRAALIVAQELKFS